MKKKKEENKCPICGNKIEVELFRYIKAKRCIKCTWSQKTGRVVA